MTISIVIPAYPMMNRGVGMLRELMASVKAQVGVGFEVVVSDDSTTNELENACRMVGMRWYGGPRKGAAANLNNAITRSRGDIIKPMFQDDKFIEPDSLQKIADALETAQWVACTSHNEGLENYDHVPYRHTSLAALREGENTYGCPSAMAWRRNDLRFDEKLHWLFDCEFYARMADRYGCPTFVDTPIFIRQWEGQATRTVCNGSQRIADTNEVVEKYRGLANG